MMRSGLLWLLALMMGCAPMAPDPQDPRRTQDQPGTGDRTPQRPARRRALTVFQVLGDNASLADVWKHARAFRRKLRAKSAGCLSWPNPGTSRVSSSWGYDSSRFHIRGLIWKWTRWASSPKVNPALRAFAHTLYCRCSIVGGGTRPYVDWKACGFSCYAKGQRQRRQCPYSHKVWTHPVVPVTAFGQYRQGWRLGNRWAPRRVRARDADFRRMEADLHNLFGVLARVHLDRSIYLYGYKPLARWQVYGRCRLRLDPKLGLVDPRTAIRGTIARAFLYMYYKYWGKRSPADTQTRPLVMMHRSRYKLREVTARDLNRLWRWHLAPPPAAWERARNKLLTSTQKASNCMIAYSRLKP